MQIIRGFDNPPLLRNAVATIGSYDGVHSGHRILLDEVVRRAKACRGESVVLTFEPHPRITLGNDEGLRLLSTFDEKCTLLEKTGVDYVVVIPFDRAFSRLSREEFINDYIVGKLNIQQLVIGYNHHFGRDRAGDHSFLVEHADLQVIEIPQYTDNGNKVSSTTIRQSLSKGNLALACEMLGHPYLIKGEADGEGRVATNRYKLLPADGCYVCRINGRESECELRGGVLYQQDFYSQNIEIEL